MFTGDGKIPDILHVVENGISLQHDAHGAFSGTLGGELKRRRRMGIAVISLMYSALSTSNARESEREQSCTFLTSLATTPRTQMCSLSTFISIGSLRLLWNMQTSNYARDLITCPITVDAKLLELSERTLGCLTKEMNNRAHEWMTGLLLPSTFPSLLPLRGPLLREDPGSLKNGSNSILT